MAIGQTSQYNNYKLDTCLFNYISDVVIPEIILAPRIFISPHRSFTFFRDGAYTFYAKKNEE